MTIREFIESFKKDGYQFKLDNDTVFIMFDQKYFDINSLERSLENKDYSYSYTFRLGELSSHKPLTSLYISANTEINEHCKEYYEIDDTLYLFMLNRERSMKIEQFLL